MTPVFEVVAKVICENIFGPYDPKEADKSDHSPSGQARIAAKAAIDAYHDYIRKQLGKRLTDQAEIMVKRSEVTRLREQAKRLEAEADEIERLLYQARLQRS